MVVRPLVIVTAIAVIIDRSMRRQRRKNGLQETPAVDVVMAPRTSRHEGWPRR